MTTNGTNPEMNVEDYENMTVQKSNVAKRVAAGAAVFVGGAAAAGGAAYAATQNDDSMDESPLSEQDILNGAGVGDTYKQETEETTQESHIVYVEKPAPPANDAPNDDSDDTSITWDNTTEIYVDGEKMGSIEEGTIEGYNFALVDKDADNHADYLAIDMNNNGTYEEDEIFTYTPEDNVLMGHETAHVTEKHYDSTNPIFGDNNDNDVANNDDDMIHNNFEDEKTGEEYNGDYAENNPDYNPNGEVDGYSDHADNYLAENDNYDDEGNYSAELNEDSHDMASDETLDESDSFDSMMSGEEFLG